MKNKKIIGDMIRIHNYGDKKKWTASNCIIR